jgi:hypothetical protein
MVLVRPVLVPLTAVLPIKVTNPFAISQLDGVLTLFLAQRTLIVLSGLTA